MTFEQLLHGAEILSERGNPEVTGLQYDSRRVQRGDVFVAMKGESADGNLYIDSAIGKGAVAVVTDSAAEKPRGDIAWAVTTHGRRALARLSANLYRHPAQRLAVTGITGTNGKTTTSFLVEAMLRAAKRKSVLIGTIEYHVAGRTVPAPHTTPEALEIEHILSEGLGQGASEAVMEVSSHALAQERVYGIPFDVAVFTNLTRDHLDYHQDFDSYFKAKSVLFEGCGTEAPRAAVINVDEDYGKKLVKISHRRGSRLLTCGFGAADFKPEHLDVGANGTRFDMVTPRGTLPLFSPLIGKVNVYNILAASAAAYARDCSLEQIAAGVGALARVPGRFEQVDAGQPFSVVVDYAHTDDALRNLTALAREFVKGRGGRVITIFGCGGDRDRKKRPLMGEAAGRGSDFVVLTSDNPRSEDPAKIIEEGEAGLKPTGTAYRIEPDRARAIALAIKSAQPGDIVLVAGKGHEKVQVTRTGASPFDDVEVAREALHAAGYSEAVAGKAVDR